MPYKLLTLFAIALASAAFAAGLAIPKSSTPHNVVQCWPDENAKTCWQHAEYRR